MRAPPESLRPIDRAADLRREVHHLADLLRVRARQRAAEHGEVLREHADRAAVDGAVPGDDAVAEDLLLLHAEVGAAMRDEPVELDEAALVEQRLDALARGELAGLVLLVDAGLAAGELRLRLHLLEAARSDRSWDHGSWRVTVRRIVVAWRTSREARWRRASCGCSWGTVRPGCERLLAQVLARAARIARARASTRRRWYPFEQFVELNLADRPAVRQGRPRPGPGARPLRRRRQPHDDLPPVLQGRHHALDPRPRGAAVERALRQRLPRGADARPEDGGAPRSAASRRPHRAHCLSVHRLGRALDRALGRQAASRSPRPLCRTRGDELCQLDATLGVAPVTTATAAICRVVSSIRAAASSSAATARGGSAGRGGAAGRCPRRASRRAAAGCRPRSR